MKHLASMMAAAVCSLVLAAPVLAAAPANDTYATRQVVASIPYSDSLDTSEATTDALDAEANADCVAPATDASVWYEYVPVADGLILVDASGSDYAVGIIVLEGSPGGFSIRNCGGGSVAAYASAGVTLTILVFDYDGTGNGGNLALTIATPPPPAELDVTVNASGSVNARTGVATIRGTVTCTGAGELDAKTFISLELNQTVGRFQIRGWGWTDFACDGATHDWAADVAPDAGKFGGGKARVLVFVVACTYDCSEATVERAVTLRK